MDIDTGETTYIGDFNQGSNIMTSLMCDTAGNMYSYDVKFGENSYLYSIDKETGEATIVGDMGYDFCYGSDGKFDRDNNILYIASYILDQYKTGLFICAPETGECTLVGYFPDVIEVVGLVIPYMCPQAIFTWTPLTPPPGEPVFFNASASYDPDGYITLYEWDWDNDGVYDESHTTPTATHIWTSPGGFPVTLQVTDDTGITARKTRTVNIVDQPPVQPTINGPANGTVNHSYAFSAGPITDPEGDSMYIMWAWGDGTTTDWLGPYASGQIISMSHTWTRVGVYGVQAKLKDVYRAESNWSDPYLITIMKNEPPGTPTIEGNAEGRPDTTYLYTFETIDPEADDVFYYIDWGDNTTTGWLGPYSSGVQKTATHSWSQQGTYTIKIQAKDTWGAESEWGTISVKIPFSVDIHEGSFFEWLWSRFPHAFPVLRYLLGYL
jgi:hypothetical protein